MKSVSPKFIVTILCISLLCACTIEDEYTILKPSTNSPNILLLIMDDVGLDAMPGYDLGSTKPHMPILQNLMNTGLKFNNLWSNPTCNPTRASMLTGKYGFRNGVTKVGDELPISETSLQDYIRTNTGDAYANAVIGKWHLSSLENHPTAIGIDYYAGLLSGGVQSYWDWNLTLDGVTNANSSYSTTKFTDLAINWIDQQSKPWFLWLAYNAPHTPFHLPPTDLHYQGNLPTDQTSIDANPQPYYMAMLEAMDTEIGRLLNSMSQEEKDNTIIICIGDNGTPAQVVQEYNKYRAKGTVYQGGINVPMVISGKNVSRINESENALLNTTDLFVTIARLAGVTIDELHDSKNFTGLLSNPASDKRTYVFAENGISDNSSDVTIRNTTHKYILFADGTEALFNLEENPLESPNLLNSNQLPLSNTNTQMLTALKTALTNIKN